MAIKVIKPGLATTVQDLGRPGYYHLGIPLSGGMDRFALRAANLLVGNDEGAAGARSGLHGAGARVSPTTRRSPSPAPSCRPRSTATQQRDLDVVRGEDGPDAVVRLS